MAYAPLFDASTGKLMLINSSSGGGTGTVTSVSVVSANGLAGTVATPTTTPAITLSTSITGVLKGNGIAISAASAGTDYVAPNVAIVGATKTKVTYDAKGLVTVGADATTADIADSLNKRYVTDANLTVIGNTSNTNTGDQTYINPREVTIATSATPTPNSDTTDIYTITALAEAPTFGAPTGTPVQGRKLIVRILDNGTARALAFNAIYVARGVALPTTTTLSKYLYLGFIYNSTASKWDLVASSQEA